MLANMKLFVWDLHGTLEQGNEDAVVEISNMALEQLGYHQRFTQAHGRELYGQKWFEYFAFLLPDEPQEKHLELQKLSFKLSDGSAHIMAKHMQPATNALSVLAAIAATHQQILISNTIPTTIPLFLKALGMDSYFDKQNAFAVNNHQKEITRTKQDVLAEYLQGKAFDDIIVIGDSDSDMEVAEYAGGKGYLYAHAHLPFRSEKGYARINDLAEVLTEL